MKTLTLFTLRNYSVESIQKVNEKMSVTIKDVASKAGVSIATVSRYFSDRDKLKESTAVRIQKTIEELDYIPNNNARSLKVGQSSIVGLVVPDITIGFFYNVVKALNEIFYNNGYFLMICDSGYRPERERHHVKSLLKMNAELIIVATVGNNVDFLSSIGKKYDKLILLDRFEPNVNVDSLCYDHRKTAKQLTDLIIKKYPKDFIIMMGPSYSPVTRDRLAGIYDSFNEHSIDESKIQIIDGICSSVQAEQALNEVVTNKQFPKTVIFSNQNCIEGIMRSVWKNNIKINEELFISGFTIDTLYNMYNFKGICAIQDNYKIGLLLGDFCMKKLKSKTKSNAPKNVFITLRMSEE